MSNNTDTNWPQDLDSIEKLLRIVKAFGVKNINTKDDLIKAVFESDYNKKFEQTATIVSPFQMAHSKGILELPEEISPKIKEDFF